MKTRPEKAAHWGGKCEIEKILLMFAFWRCFVALFALDKKPSLAKTYYPPPVADSSAIVSARRDVLSLSTIRH